jgi:SH3-like domain-containing protein
VIESKSLQAMRSLRRRSVLAWSMSCAAIGSGALLPAFSAVHAQSPAAAPAPAAAPKPAARNPAAAGSATATPQVIRPSATLGPAAPAASGGAPPAGAPGAAGAATAGRDQQATAAAGSAPRVAGVARFRSVSKPDAVMFDAPSDKAKKIFLAPQGMPVEVISVLRTWVKVRDPLGDLAWISRDDLSDRRMIMATTVAALRREAEPYSPTWFSVDRGVLLELLEEKPVNGFLRVRYAEGQVGYIQPEQVWGL